MLYNGDYISAQFWKLSDNVFALRISHSFGFRKTDDY